MRKEQVNFDFWLSAHTFLHVTNVYANFCIIHNILQSNRINLKKYQISHQKVTKITDFRPKMRFFGFWSINVTFDAVSVISLYFFCNFVEYYVYFILQKITRYLWFLFDQFEGDKYILNCNIIAIIAYFRKHFFVSTV